MAMNAQSSLVLLLHISKTTGVSTRTAKKKLIVLLVTSGMAITVSFTLTHARMERIGMETPAFPSVCVLGRNNI